MGNHIDKELENIPIRAPILEKDSRVRVGALEKYILHSESDVSTQTLVREGSYYVLTEDLSLSALYKNSCEALYCVQYRAGFENIPSLLWRGLIGIEDSRFVSHPGIDLKSIARALITDIKEMRFAQGGSTITQQLVKNLFFSNERKLIRKIKEAIYALYIESQYEKDQILAAYFNEVFWGTLSGVKIKGFYAASLAFFSKRPEKLQEYEVAILVSLLKGPNYYSPIFHPERLKERAKVVFETLKEKDFIVDLNSKWSDKKFDLWVKNLKKNHEQNWLKDIYKTLERQTHVVNQFESFVFQRAVTNIVTRIYERVEEKDFAVKALIGEVGCYQNCDYFSFYSKFERSKEKAIEEERHQVGSILKPIFYQILLHNGVKLTDLVETKPITLNLKSGKWTPKDSSQGEEEEITVLRALRKSRNIPLVRIASEVGFKKIENEAILYLPQLKVPLAQYPSQMLGAVELSVKDVFDTYRQYIQTECQRIEDGEYSFEESLMYLLSEHDETTISKIVNSKLKDAPFFGKTGTTNKGLDNWYVAFDGKYIYAIWFGIEGSREGEKLRLSGASSSFQIFQDFQVYRGKRFNELGCMHAMPKTNINL